MKEFIEKLIERLEEERKEYTSEYGLIDMQVQEVFVNVRKIVNQLAEEYINTSSDTSSGWVACSERLPSKEEYQKSNGQFIVSDGNRTYATYFDIYDTLKFGEPTIDYFRVDKCVIAWQSLPAPYKEGE